MEVQQRGRKVQSEHFFLLVLERPGNPRIGITVSSKVGNAVVRNRLKRWVREYVRRHKVDLPSGHAAIIAKASAGNLVHAIVDSDLARLLVRAGKDARR